jgi:hypothetical protein
VAWGANAPSLSTVIAAAAMMNERRPLSTVIAELANRVSTKLRHHQAPEKKKSNF